MIWLADVLSQFRSSPRRALAVEIACLVPALALVAIAGFGWGGYFWLQQRVQTAADHALDAALAAPDIHQRLGLARAAAARVLEAPVFDLELRNERGRPTLRLAYDASASPIFALSRVSAMPPPVIVRLASRP